MREIKTVLILAIIEVGRIKAIPPPSFQNSRIEYTDGLNAPDEPSSGPQPSGPYPPSGWAPPGNLLLVPGETHSSQQDGYGPPPPPNNQYTPTPDLTTQKPTTTTTPSDLNQDVEESPVNGKLGRALDNDEQGQYYVFLPDGKLQKVQYSGKQKGRGQYEAQVQYEEVDPIRTPVYSYQNVPFHHINP